jgi:hypothetical protein
VVRTKETLAGFFFTIIGLVAVLVSRGYSLGTALDMGPGYFPMIVGGILTIFGAIMLVGGMLRNDKSDAVVTSDIKLRPLLFVILSVVAFGALVERAGLIIALMTMVLIARFAGRQGSILEVVLMMILITGFAVALFVYGLKIPFELGPV